MVRLALQNTAEARPAYALLAGRHVIDAMLRQYLHDGLVRRHRVRATASRERDVERLARARRSERVGGEVLDVDGLRRPGSAGNLLDQIHEWARTADVQMSANGPL